MKMQDAVMELEANRALYAGSNVVISQQAAQGVLQYIWKMERKIQIQKVEIKRLKSQLAKQDCRI